MSGFSYKNFLIFLVGVFFWSSAYAQYEYYPYRIHTGKKEIFCKAVVGYLNSPEGRRYQDKSPEDFISHVPGVSEMQWESVPYKKYKDSYLFLRNNTIVARDLGSEVKLLDDDGSSKNLKVSFYVSKVDANFDGKDDVLVKVIENFYSQGKLIPLRSFYFVNDEMKPIFNVVDVYSSHLPFLGGANSFIKYKDSYYAILWGRVDGQVVFALDKAGYRRNVCLIVPAFSSLK